MTKINTKESSHKKKNVEEKEVKHESTPGEQFPYGWIIRGPKAMHAVPPVPIKVGAMNNKIKITPKITLSEDLANLGTLT